MYNKFGCCLKNVFNLITIYPLKVFFRKTINFGQGEKIRMSDMQLAVVIIISGLVIVFLALIAVSYTHLIRLQRLLLKSPLDIPWMRF